jgi:hypothetical protein
MSFLKIIKPLDELLDHHQALQKEIAILSLSPNQSGSFRLPYATDQRAWFWRLEYIL